ncbi:hypothetical protein BJY04DRAFT_184605 [Aspergillus karnatakaensis]|uniref:uncharacterized protein n=1 Tax=Aspergillus karnatakaensis TaxID=1810916 RepID=UPI003CCC9B8C
MCVQKSLTLWAAARPRPAPMPQVQLAHSAISSLLHLIPPSSIAFAPIRASILQTTIGSYATLQNPRFWDVVTAILVDWVYAP